MTSTRAVAGVLTRCVAGEPGSRSSGRGEAGRDLLTAIGGIVLTTIGVSLIAESVTNHFPGLRS